MMRILYGVISLRWLYQILEISSDKRASLISEIEVVRPQELEYVTLPHLSFGTNYIQDYIKSQITPETDNSQVKPIYADSRINQA